jgi:hypothetical protein
MAINAHQVTAEKWLESHDEQLILIIPVVGCYNMHRYCDRWLRRKPTWTAPYWVLLNGPEENFPQLF